MAISRLFNTPIDVVKTTTAERDSIGGIASETTSSETVYGWLEPVAASEDREQRETQMGRWIAYVPPLTDVTGWDTVEALGHTFNVDGPPSVFTHPVTTDPIYRQVPLREVL